MKIILDTCALIWWSLDPDLLSVSAKNLCDEMEQKKNGLVASISLWEIALKVKKIVSVQGVVRQPGALTQQKSSLWVADREKSYLS